MHNFDSFSNAAPDPVRKMMRLLFASALAPAEQVLPMA
jgi:hypothetical protein